MDEGKQYKRWLRSARWAALRRHVLTLRPVCEACGRAGACEAHHRQPVLSGAGLSGMASLMWDPSNLMALCRECHRAEHRAMGKDSKEVKAQRIKSQTEAALRRLFPAEAADPGGVF